MVEETAMNTTTATYKVSSQVGWMHLESGSTPTHMRAWRAFRNAPADAERLGTVIADDGNEYVIGQFTEWGRTRDIYWPVANDPAAADLAAYDPRNFTWVVRGLQDLNAETEPGTYDQAQAVATRWTSELRQGGRPTQYEQRGYTIQRIA